MAGKSRKSRGVTLADVAREAGVSAVTVSRAIRLPEKVSEEARGRIRAAIDRLGYVPDPAASALASARTNVVGLLVPSLTNAVFADLLRGVYDAVEGTGLTVQIGNFRYAPGKEEDLIRTFLRQRPAGLIVTGLDQTDAARALLAQAPCPVVQTMDASETPVDRIIGFSQQEGGRLAARHLLERGYARPGFLGARMDPRSQERMRGFLDELGRAGRRDRTRVLTTPHPSSVGLGGQLLSDLLARAPDTDAVFCNNDDLAAGALFEALRRGIDVPGQLGICGFNDLEMSRHLVPALTSVATPRYEVGYGAVALVRAALADATHPPRPIRLEVTLSGRASTARA